MIWGSVKGLMHYKKYMETLTKMTGRKGKFYFRNAPINFGNLLDSENKEVPFRIMVHSEEVL